MVIGYVLRNGRFILIYIKVFYGLVGIGFECIFEVFLFFRCWVFDKWGFLVLFGFFVFEFVFFYFYIKV